MRYQLCCFLAFWTFSLTVHEGEIGQGRESARLECRTLIGLSLAELSEIDVRRI